MSALELWRWMKLSEFYTMEFLPFYSNVFRVPEFMIHSPMITNIKPCEQFRGPVSQEIIELNTNIFSN